MTRPRIYIEKELALKEKIKVWLYVIMMWEIAFIFAMLWDLS